VQQTRGEEQQQDAVVGKKHLLCNAEWKRSMEECADNQRCWNDDEDNEW